MRGISKSTLKDDKTSGGGGGVMVAAGGGGEWNETGLVCKPQRE